MNHHTRSLSWSFLSALFLAATVASGAGPARVPSVRPKAVVPPMARPPTIDGALSDGEWPTLHVARWVGGKDDYLAERAGEFWVGADSQRLYVAWRTAVHPTLGAVARMPPREGDVDAMELSEDDGVEIWVSRSPFGGSGEHLVMLSPTGAVRDEIHGQGSQPRTNWTASVTQAHRVQAGVWVGEVAIELESLSISGIEGPIALRVCRNFQKPKEQCRWAPKVNYFSLPTTMPTVLFDPNSPIVSETGFQDADGIRMGVDLTNPGTNAMPLAVRLSCQIDRETPGSVLEQSIALAPGETKRVELVRSLAGAQFEPGVAFGEILVRAAKGGACYHRDVRWRLRPPNALWDD